MACSTAATSPEITICEGELRFAGTTVPGAGADAAASALPMPTYWAPWPGKSSAVFMRLEAHGGRAPGEAAAEGHQRDDVAGAHPAAPHRLVQRDGHGGRRCVAVLVDVHE